MTQKKKFKTVDVLALYFGKNFAGEQLEAIVKLYDFLTRKPSNMLPLHYVAAQKPLQKQVKWLNGLKLPDRKADREEWLANLIHNHGDSVELEPFSSVDAKKVLSC